MRLWILKTLIFRLLRPKTVKSFYFQGMKWLFAVVFFSISARSVSAQDIVDTIRVNFLYGSVPARGFRTTEKPAFGGLKGGHVNIQSSGRVLDFRPHGTCHIVPVGSKPNGGFDINNGLYWDTATTKWASIRIPVTAAQKAELETIFSEYASSTPYDYAVFGMRCAAASYDVLSRIGLFPQMSERNNIIAHFYPKLLRKKVFSWARKHDYEIVFHEGRTSRVWESDKGLL